MGVNAQVPIAVAAGLDAGASVGAIFKRTIDSYWAFDHLETYIIQPSAPYIKASLEGQVATTIEDQLGVLGAFGTWALYMISGVAIARGGDSTRRSEAQPRGVNVNPSLGVTGIGELGFDVDHSKSQTSQMESGRCSDFVWAIRLCKIEQKYFKRRLALSTVSKGATYSSAKDGDENIENVLSEEGLEIGEEAEVFNVDGHSFFVLQK